MSRVSPIPMFTSRYNAVSDFGKLGLERGFCPVVTSLGRPRWMKTTGWASVPELAPKGFKDAERGEFKAFYLARLDSFGLEAIHAKLRTAWRMQTPGVWTPTPVEERLPLALLCFEDIRKAWCHRSLFAEWWLENAQQALPEFNTADQLPAGAPTDKET